MKLRILVAVLALGCGDSTTPDPVLPPLTLGSFALVTLDGQPLPRQVTLDGNPCGVSASSFALTADTTIEWLTVCAEPTPVNVFLRFDTFRQIAVDSFVAPRLPPQSSVSPTIFGSRKGTTLTIVTQPHHPYGAHNWVFSASP